MFPFVPEHTSPVFPSPEPKQDEMGAPPWQLVYTIARHEKIVAAQLEARGISNVLPRYKSSRRWNNRTFEVELPLFPSYVFLRCNSTNRSIALSVPGIVSLVSFNGHPASVDDAQVMGIANALKYRDAHPCAYLAKGHRVRIVSGPLSGIVGVIHRIKGLRVIVSIDSISSSVSIEVRAGELIEA